MQERLLSTRLLLFHHGRIDWICTESHPFAGSSSSHSVNMIDESVTRDNRMFSKLDLGPSNVNTNIKE